MPRTFMISSIFLNGPFFVRYCTTRSAVFGPMPGSDAIWAAVALLRLTTSVETTVAVTGGLVARPAAPCGFGVPDCAASGDDTNTRATTSANTERFILSSFINLSWGPTPTTCTSRPSAARQCDVSCGLFRTTCTSQPSAARQCNVSCSLFRTTDTSQPCGRSAVNGPGGVCSLTESMAVRHRVHACAG